MRAAGPSLFGPFLRRGLVLLLALGGALSPRGAWAVEAPAGVIRIEHQGQVLDWPGAVDRLARADVVYLGEQHDDPATHRLERALLEALHTATRRRLVLSLEMFERDVQGTLDDYLQGRIPESEFLSRTRPWPNYASDYRPLVEYARANGIRVLAANLPRRIAARVAREGLQAVSSLPPEDQGLAASHPECPKDRLYQRFLETMRGHPGVTEEGIGRMFEAQCLKDATMAEAIAGCYTPDSPPTLVLQINGAFHSDERLGIPAHLEALRPDLNQVVSTAVPTASASGPVSPGLADLLFLVGRERP